MADDAVSNNWLAQMMAAADAAAKNGAGKSSIEGSTAPTMSLPSGYGQWTPEKFKQQTGGMGVPIGTPNTTAQEYAALYNEALKLASSGSSSAPTPPAGMAKEDYIEFLDMANQAATRNALESRANEVAGLAKSGYTDVLSNPALASAMKAASSPADYMDMYNAMRKSYLAQTGGDMTNQAYGIASGGTRGDSVSQLTAQGALANQGAGIASLLPQAQTAASSLRAQDIQSSLAPVSLLAQAASDRTKSLADIYGQLYGSPTSLYLR